MEPYCVEPFETVFVFSFSLSTIANTFWALLYARCPARSSGYGQVKSLTLASAGEVAGLLCYWGADSFSFQKNPGIISLVASFASFYIGLYFQPILFLKSNIHSIAIKESVGRVQKNIRVGNIFIQTAPPTPSYPLLGALIEIFCRLSSFVSPPSPIIAA